MVGSRKGRTFLSVNKTSDCIRTMLRHNGKDFASINPEFLHCQPDAITDSTIDLLPREGNAYSFCRKNNTMGTQMDNGIGHCSSDYYLCLSVNSLLSLSGGIMAPQLKTAFPNFPCSSFDPCSLRQSMSVEAM